MNQSQNIITELNYYCAGTTTIAYYILVGLAAGTTGGSISSLIGTWIIPALGGHLENPWQARAAGMLGGMVFGGCIGLLYGLKKARDADLARLDGYSRTPQA